MIELLNTTFAHGAMLRPCRFVNITCLTLILLLEHDSIIFEFLYSHKVFPWVTILAKNSWINPARHEVASVAHEHQNSASVLVVVVQVLIWDSGKSIFNIDIESSESTNKVDDLYKWIWFKTYIPC